MSPAELQLLVPSCDAEVRLTNQDDSVEMIEMNTTTAARHAARSAPAGKRFCCGGDGSVLASLLPT
jgi:hypothetical protein